MSSTPSTRAPSHEITDEEKADYASASPSLKQGDTADATLVPAKSRGVRQMEALSNRMSVKYRVLLYGGFALLAYVMSLDQYTNRSYLSAATSVSFAAHSTLTTISALKSVFQVRFPRSPKLVLPITPF